MSTLPPETFAHGLTFLCSAIMIRVATIGYKRPPEFELDATEQPSVKERAVYALKNRKDVREAAIREGIDLNRVHTPVRKPQAQSRAKL